MKKIGVYIEVDTIIAFEDNLQNRAKYSHATKDKTQLPTWKAKGDKLDAVYQILVKYSDYDEIRIHVGGKKTFRAVEYGRSNLRGHKKQNRDKLKKIYDLLDALNVKVFFSPVCFPSSNLKTASTSKNQAKRSKKYKNGQFNKRGKRLSKNFESIDRKTVYRRDWGICYLCENPVGIQGVHIDHIIPLTRGGDHSYNNLAVSCPSCNMSKGNKVIDELNPILAKRVEAKLKWLDNYEMQPLPTLSDISSRHLLGTSKNIDL